MPFDPKKVDKASNVEKQLSSYKAPCRGCSKKVTLAKMRSHISSCMKIQEQMASCPKFVPVVPTSQPIPCNIPNRSTFVCPYCGARNLDQQELVKHCMENHRSDPNRVVCPICSAMPWGDPSYKSANFLQHLLHRHKFSYDTFVPWLVGREQTEGLGVRSLTSPRPPSGRREGGQAQQGWPEPRLEPLWRVTSGRGRGEWGLWIRDPASVCPGQP
ncbi:E3 ubiquitin-protein ligase RNF166 isoform X2 [Sminthopsis crassicaudata]|uniref:E3 ubiquitin-protein ligase RNF166 isoform X2 n=1 Tax=Sminthopsis crassicaudata TaxID=9301 RepID=UPI003D690C51